MSTMYTLTAMTGKEASANRTVIIGTVEVNWRVWMILIWTAPLALLATVVLWVFIGQIALLAIPLVEGGAVFLIHRRTSQGLKLRTYQALWDKKKADLNTFILCAQKIQVTETDYRILMPNSVPYVEPEPASSEAYVDQLMTRPVPAGVVPVAELDRPGPPADSGDSSVFGRPTLNVRRPEPSSAASPVPQRATAPTPPSPYASGAASPHPKQRLDSNLIGRESNPDAIDVSAWLDTPRHDPIEEPQ